MYKTLAIDILIISLAKFNGRCTKVALLSHYLASPLYCMYFTVANFITIKYIVQHGCPFVKNKADRALKGSAEPKLATKIRNCHVVTIENKYYIRST